MACQAPLSMGFSRQEYWNGLPFPSPEELPNTGIEPWSPASQADSLPLSYREVLSSLNRTKHAYIFTYVHVYVCIQTYLCVFYIMLCFICLSVHIYSNTHMHGYMWASQVVNGKEPTTNAGDVRDLGSTPRSKICPGGQHAKILVFWMLSFKRAFSLSSFTFIKRLFSSFSLSAIRVLSSECLRLLIFLLAILIPAYASSSPAFHMMCSA